MENNIKTGWICLRCGVVNAPHVDQCACYLQTTAVPIMTIGPFYDPWNFGPTTGDRPIWE